MNNYKELIVWKKSIDFAVEIYELLKGFPKAEMWGLCSQLQRSSSSVAANIAEGAGRNSNKEFIHFLSIALGSLYETDTFLTVAQKIGYITDTKFESLSQSIGELDKMIKGLQKSKQETS